MDDTERQKRLYCTPCHITKALLKREFFPGSIWEPAAGRGDIVRVLQECNYPDVHSSDINAWGFQPCVIEDFLKSTRQADCLITNPPFHLKFQFLEQAKRLVRHKIALLLPVEFEYTMAFIKHHETDSIFPWKGLYVFPQSFRWLNMPEAWGKIRFGWYVFERGAVGEVVREKILFRRNKSKVNQTMPSKDSE
jgi:hypothetical protein